MVNQILYCGVNECFPIPFRAGLGRARRRLALGGPGLCPAGAGRRRPGPDRARQVAGLAGYALLGGIGAVAVASVLCGLAARRPPPSPDAHARRRSRRHAPMSPGRSPATMARWWTAIPSIAAWPAPSEGESAAAARTGAGGRALRRRALSPVARCRRRQSRARKPFGWCRGLRSSPRCARLTDKQTAWWFTPRLAASTSPQPVLAAQTPPPPRRSRSPRPCARAAAPRRATDVGDLFRDAPMGVAFADANGVITRSQCRLRAILRPRRRAGRTEFRRAGGSARPRPGAWR